MSSIDSVAPDEPAARASTARLWCEFVAIFVGVPILMAFFFEEIQRNRALFGTIWAFTGIAALLLWRTPGWSFSKLWKGPVLREWPIILAFWVLTAATCWAFVFAVAPERFLIIVTHRPELWILIMVAYPILSAWPQEVIYRSLFFERYEGLFPSRALLLLANGFVFGFGHLFYMNWITITMTAVGGMFMGWAYLRHRSMTLAWVLHSLAGQLIFTIGLGHYFYSGNIG